MRVRLLQTAAEPTMTGSICFGVPTCRRVEEAGLRCAECCVFVHCARCILILGGMNNESRRRRRRRCRRCLGWRVCLDSHTEYLCCRKPKHLAYSNKPEGHRVIKYTPASRLSMLLMLCGIMLMLLQWIAFGDKIIQNHMGTLRQHAA